MPDGALDKGARRGDNWVAIGNGDGAAEGAESVNDERRRIARNEARTVVSEENAVAVIMFGSHARGDARPASAVEGTFARRAAGAVAMLVATSGGTAPPRTDGPFNVLEWTDGVLNQAGKTP